MSLRSGGVSEARKGAVAGAESASENQAEERSSHSTLGARIRSFRNEKSLSLAEVSRAAGVSVAMLSRIERGKSMPSLKVLEKLRAALDLTMGDLFPPSAAAALHGDICPVVRERDRISLDFDEIGLTKQRLSPGDKSDLELLLLLIQPGGGSGPEPWTRPGEKAGLVVSGAARLEIGGDVYELNAGDSFQFDSSKPHRFEALGDQAAQILWIIKSNPLAKAVDA